jgi:hypothetical protein
MASTGPDPAKSKSPRSPSTTSPNDFQLYPHAIHTKIGDFEWEHTGKYY